MNLKEFAELLTHYVDWHSYAGFCNDLKNDRGFKSNSNNMSKSEKRDFALAYFCSLGLDFVDKKGQDFRLTYRGEESKTEGKTLNKMYRIGKSTSPDLISRNILGKGDTFPVKMYNSQGNCDPEELLEKVRNQKTYDFVILGQTDPFMVGVVEGDYARSRLYAPKKKGSNNGKVDGLMADFEKDHIAMIDIQKLVPVTLHNNNTSVKFDIDFNGIYSDSDKQLLINILEEYKKRSSFKPPETMI